MTPSAGTRKHKSSEIDFREPPTVSTTTDVRMQFRLDDVNNLKKKKNPKKLFNQLIKNLNEFSAHLRRSVDVEGEKKKKINFKVWRLVADGGVAAGQQKKEKMLKFVFELITTREGVIV